MARSLLLLRDGERPRVLVLPLASVEHHGILPAGADYLLAECASRRLLEMLPSDAAIAPVLPFTTAREHEGLGITLGAEAHVFIEYLASLLSSAAKAAEDAAVALVFHGGAWCSTYAAAREARRRTGKLVIALSFWDAVSRLLEEKYGVPRYPIHADPVEASLLAACGVREGVRLVSAPEALEAAKRGAERLRGLPSPWLGEDMPEALYPSSPVPASVELGEELLSSTLRALAASLAGEKGVGGLAQR